MFKNLENLFTINNVEIIFQELKGKKNYKSGKTFNPKGGFLKL